MPKPLSIDRAVDKHLKPVKDSDGTLTALEVSTDNVRIKNDLDIGGDAKFGGDISIVGDASMTGDIVLRHPTSFKPSITIECASDTAYGSILQFIHNSISPATADRLGTIFFYGNDSTGVSTNYATIEGLIESTTHTDEEGKLVFAVCAGTAVPADGLILTGNDGVIDTTIGLGATSMTTIKGDLDIDGDAITTAGAITLDSGGAITLDAHDGSFISMNAGTEFSAANSAYAGMILGCTHVFGSGTAGQYQSISTTWTNLLWDTDKYALVTFVVPPSNIVKISVHLPYIAAASYVVQLGLATDSSATSLNAKYQNTIDDANRADSFNINYSWIVAGSDHSWSAGETKTIYIMAYGSNAVRFYTGGTNANRQGGVIVEATALPATIGDGSEP